MTKKTFKATPVSKRMARRYAKEIKLRSTAYFKAWVNKQKKHFREGKLSPDQIKLLESLPDWTWETEPRKGKGAK